MNEKSKRFNKMYMVISRIFKGMNNDIKKL
jgi:hypothetical protein